MDLSTRQWIVYDLFANATQAITTVPQWRHGAALAHTDDGRAFMFGGAFAADVGGGFSNELWALIGDPRDTATGPTAACALGGR